MSMTIDNSVAAFPKEGTPVVDEALLDRVMDAVDERGVALTGEGGFLPELIKAVLERGMKAELTGHLGYEKNDPAGRGSGNSRNGTTPRTLHTEVGPVQVDAPRDRAGTFSSALVPSGARRLGGLDDMIISLYAGGMSIREIQFHLAETLGTELSHETISNVTEQVMDEVYQWQHRPLEAFYPVIFMDAIVVKVREQNRVSNRCAHLAVGVDTDGVRHVLGIWVQAHEGAKFWSGVCAELANRGIKDVLIVACDGLTGFPEAIEATWPMACVQTCVVHLIRSSMRFVSYKDRKALAKELKTIYTAANEDAAQAALEAFAHGQWGRKYPAAVDVWRRAWERFIPFLAFGPATRRAIYTTNAIESLNYQLRKIIKAKGQFPNDTAVVKVLWLAIRNIEERRARQRAKEAGRPKGTPRKAPSRLIEGSTIQNWQQALGELALHYPERFPNP